jgi:uncharacterized lipoprotein YajG
MSQIQRMTAALLAALFLSAGCASAPNRQAQWPSLPSPWSTIKETQTRLATAAAKSAEPAINSGG